MAAKVEPAFVGKMAIRFGNGVVMHGEINRQLPHRRKTIARLKSSGDEEGAESGENLLVGRNRRIAINAKGRRG
jgi:hypothetical protein